MPLSKQRLKQLEDHPETVHINVFGTEQPFLLNIASSKRLRAEGVEVIPVLISFVNRIGGLFATDRFDDLELGSEKGLELLKQVIQNEDLENLAVLTYWGLKTFERDLELEEVEAFLTLGALVRAFPKLLNAFTSFTEDTQPEDLVDTNGVDEEEGN